MVFRRGMSCSVRGQRSNGSDERIDGSVDHAKSVLNINAIVENREILYKQRYNVIMLI